MAEVTPKRLGQIVRGVFTILMQHPEGMHVKDVLGRLAQDVPPTDFEEAAYESRPEQRRYEIVARFATIASVKAGWIVKEKGTWSLTDAGRKAYNDFLDPEALYRESRRLYRAWKASRQEASEEDEAEQVAEQGATANAIIEEAVETAWSGIENYLTNLNAYDFQEVVAGLLEGMGYHISWVAPPGADGGIDIIAHCDPLGVEGARIKVQVKRRANRVAVDEARSFMAMLSEGDVGIFVSAGGFTRDAEEFARMKETRRMTLLDLQGMFDLWVEHYNDIPDARRRLVPIQPVHYLVGAE